MGRKLIQQKVEDKFRTMEQQNEKVKENLVLHQELEKQKKRTDEIAELQTENKKLKSDNGKIKDARQRLNAQCTKYVEKIEQLEAKISKLKDGGRTVDYGTNYMRDTKVGVGRSY